MSELKEKIPKGYKQTEVGVIPEDWEVKRLGDVLNYEQPSKYIIQGDIYSNNFGVPVLTAGKSFILGYTNKKTNIFKNLPVIIFDDFTTACKYVDFNFKVKSSAIKLLKTKKERDSLKFFAGVMQIINFNVQEHKRYWISEYRNIKIGTPESQEQTAIANVLSDTDTLIEKLEKLIAKKKAIKQGAMQVLLTGKKRLPGFSEDWEVKRLGDVFDILKGSGLSKSKLARGGRYQCILYGEIFTRYNEVIHKVFGRTNYKEGVCSNVDDILLPGSTTTIGIDLARASALKNKNVLLGGDINILRYKKNKINSEFIARSLTHIYKNEIAKRAKGITVYHLHGKDLFGLKISFPKDIKEQTAIANILSNMDKEIESLEKKLKKYKKIKVGMMQQLLTGKIRIYEPAKQ